MGGQVNPLADWAASAHALSTSKISPQALLGSYPTVGADACISCHAPHNASGTSRLLRGLNEQDCIACHNGGTNISPMPQYANVFAEYATPKVGHPFPASTNPHDAAEAVLLNNDRHATCVDCHSAHGSQPVGVFPPSPLIRVSQKDVAGISASDGTSVLTPAVNQYENCLRCHGTSSGKQVLPIYGYFPVRAVSAGDPLNLIPQFAVTAYVEPSGDAPAEQQRFRSPACWLNMLNLDGITPGRAMGTQIFCTDCHNSDDNREFGGTGANGPHGSRWTHILERQYQFSQAATPGALISNLFPNPDLSVNGPYALCGKCHDLANQVMKNTSFNDHANHINAGFSLFDVPYSARHGSHQRQHQRRAAGELRCERRGAEWKLSDFLQSCDEYVHAGMSPDRAQSERNCCRGHCAQESCGTTVSRPTQQAANRDLNHPSGVKIHRLLGPFRHD